MKVGLDITPLTGNRTGVGTFCLNWAKCFLDSYPHIELHGFSSGMNRANNPILPKLKSWKHVPIPTRLLYQVWRLLGLPRVDKMFSGLDLFHATNYFLPPVKKCKRIVTIYDLVFIRYPEFCSPKIVGPFHRSVIRFAREADAVVTCSESSKQELMELANIPSERIFVAYGGVPEDLRFPRREEAVALLQERYGVHVPFILYVGTLEPRKNVVGLLEAFLKVAGDLPHSLVLVGAVGWKTEPFFERLERTSHRERVVLPGYVPAADLPLFYAAADVFLFPSFYEGFGLPVVEAFAAGCPVIASNRSSLPEVVGDAGILVNPEDHDALAAAIRSVVSDAAIRKILSEKGKARASQFTWARSTQTLFQAYQKVVA
ncbi:MAG TPA: glycosyltransferase family 1 protein [Candidatus Hydrogenedentes bacterium]|nr:glycosyltransferase family 1 protein [Candidatus Hydrogenedentota bacterium]HOL77156.1 glycosyltransferase family 1 protein [Candidatus Hydrogenedentota bacterium]HPO85905.1 glycosyltransferase family 1 protein [Candidatus Hydrogenedentota bacterium]